ncbi:MAG TPA: metalloregulator ArsR/SmtB family transcription factor [Alloacidobacterium sp.]|nr:metalloregulator ArsR/SmtB family transcription factor [Alloacidobacterium sp.]
MSLKSPDRRQARRASHALLFAALGDKTRLALVTRLCAGQPASIAQLTAGTRLTRQAVTKHLRVLQKAGMVHSTRSGREALFSLDPEPMQQMQDYLDRVSRQWDHALARLKSFVEK